ncbi:hypothetical protein CPC08DRAFT_714427 [Agrocybe pediades]|nr:hypothetical protein CPC08DRAFT_714427 [Agrocybe pediades]
MTLEQINKSTSSVVYLSPSKRRRSPTPPLETGSTAKEIYQWILLKSPESVASCSVRDVLQMKPNETQGFDFYWLGSVPCRTVKIVGMIVGILIYEKRIIYSIDDGTAVIDCNHQHQRPARDKNAPEIPLPDLKPIARIGRFVQIVGIVKPRHETRMVLVDSIACTSPNDELLHTREVRQLHKIQYSRTKPFTIPPPRNLKTPQKSRLPPTPTTWNTTPPSSVTSSPVKPVSDELPQIYKSPIKLRHPSRLHTHDLTENTFRIYLKHYMDYSPPGPEDDDQSDNDIETSIIHIPTTPTKRARNDVTPRPSTSYRNLDSTPRPRIPPPDFGISTSRSALPSVKPEAIDNARKGFTLSYLRRVPELSLLASRVVMAVSKRRLRAEKQKLKDAGTKPTSQQKAQILAASAITPTQFAGKMKRLFQWSIVQLLKEGCLVHWDGPVRACPDSSSIANASLLWKTVGDGSSLFSTTTLNSSSSSTFIDLDVDAGALSDPDPSEEAYISLTPDFLADFVANAIKVLVDHYERIGKRYNGATKDGILSVLRKDDRWKYVGEWSIDDALELLRKQGRVWSMGKGRWDLTE